MSRTRSHILNELSITCKSHDYKSLLFIELRSKNNRSVSSKQIFIELNELSLLADFDYCSRYCFECTKFNTIFRFIHLIRESKV